MKRADAIQLRGVRQNNLKNLDVDIPLGKLTVVTGLSGAGKSSLVFETLHAEGQYRYVETFSAYTRQFLEKMDKPQVDRVENIRPSIAIQQTNTVRTSRSTVGTMTELCDYMKVWFAKVSQLFDPVTGKSLEEQHPQAVWQRALRDFLKQKILLAFEIQKPKNLSWPEVLGPLLKQGYVRGVWEGALVRLEELEPASETAGLWVIQDRLVVEPKQAARFLESAQKAFHFGQGALLFLDEQGALLEKFLERPRLSTGEPAPRLSPGLFSFNSPLGACPQCQGFGRVTQLDEQLIIPDPRLSIGQGALKIFHGEVYSQCLNDLIGACRRHHLPTNLPWESASVELKKFVWEGEPDYDESEELEYSRRWYGVKRFFDWMDTKRYKTHVRVFLSKYRSYSTCPSCKGQRLKPEALLFKWQGNTLPDLYALPVEDLEGLLRGQFEKAQTDLQPAEQGILTRLRYLCQVGLGYLTLDRTSRTLSGGEVQRVNLTACLGTSLVDTLFVLDEPSIGLHARDIDRLVGILKRLTALGNTVVVVEHDEAIMHAADHLIEIGPEPGERGGYITFQGSHAALLRDSNSLTGRYLSGAQTVVLPKARRPVALPAFEGRPGGFQGVLGKSAQPLLRIHGATKHNLKGLDLQIPLQRLVCLSGVSGSGKSTLLDHVLYQGLLVEAGKVAEDPAEITLIEPDLPFGEVCFIDQSAVSKTPRSNPALFSGAWEGIREAFAMTAQAKSSGLTASSFSFNSGDGRCEHCQGLGYEVVEMQFLSDVYVQCAVCEGKRFKPEVLKILYEGQNVEAVLHMDVLSAVEFFKKIPKIRSRLESLESVGLGYLRLGQPLNTLSGGECQRLKLIKYLSQIEEGPQHALLLLDEPTTGLHRHDIAKLIAVFQKLVDKGHSLIIIEHQMDVLRAADWIVELGPEAGLGGGQLIAQGTPEFMARTHTHTAPFLAEALEPHYDVEAAEPLFEFIPSGPPDLQIFGAREHNLKNINLTIARQTLVVLTGVSGSGKSSLADDILFAEGQRRFLESMSAYARHFVEQMPKPDVDQIIGISPTVAIEQRVTSGTQKSTVATVTEVAQYLRLLYARIGIQHSLNTGEPMAAQSLALITSQLMKALQAPRAQSAAILYLCAPLVRGRKGHHEPLAKWAKKQGYKLLRCDGELVPVVAFKKLDRYREHDIELVVADLTNHKEDARYCSRNLEQSFELGKGSAFLMTHEGEILSWFSQKTTDPNTGEAYPDLDPKHFSWNSPRGWCPTCTGHGIVQDAVCPECQGARLNPVSRAVKVFFKKGPALSLPELLALPSSLLLEKLGTIEADKRSQAIVDAVLAQIQERLRFMQNVGLDYLSLDRATATLSGGEAQRIRLAAQIGSQLSGVLYILDEPSIGLHAQDNDRLIASLKELRDKGNTVLVVEHDEAIMRAADSVIDLGPGAGRYGGELLAQGPWKEICKSKKSLTGKYLKEGIAHPLRGAYRPLPKKEASSWVEFKNLSFRTLKHFDLRLPKERLTLVCGMSGAGKSTLVHDVLQKTLLLAQETAQEALSGEAVLKKYPYFEKAPFAEASGLLGFSNIIEVDQSPIGKTPRSTPSTYIGAFDLIREAFAMLPEAKVRGFTSSSFSFNTQGGRCEACKGAGRVKLEMSFLPDTYVCCEACNGTRFDATLQDIQWRDKSISDLLQLSFEEALAFFSFHSRLSDLCQLMVETGLGYLTLGQSSPTLSGGEAQRLKLVSELALGLPSFRAKSRGQLPKNLYLLEEPTIGLHISDCHRLIELLHRLVDQGHTVVVIEHNLDLIAEADYVLELGPQGGHLGGHCLYQGALEGLKKKKTPTSAYL